LIRNLIKAGAQTDLIGLDLVELDDGEHLDVQRDGEIAAVVLSGVVDAVTDGTQLGAAGGRGSVFDGAGDTVYAPPGTLTVTARGGAARVVVITAPLADQPAADARINRPADQDIAERGEGNWARTVRTILGPGDRAGRLLVGETINPAGNWSSYPPHKHDTHEPPREVQLEEVYFFQLDPPEGFGIQLRYEGDREECFTVRNDDTAAIKSGYHPVVGAPGYRLYYLWAMAGQGRQMIPYLDPRYAWVQEGR
jgi:5-deoxy-glucuronate isomerase